MKIVILAGGDGPERKISLMSGKAVFSALKQKHRTVILDTSNKHFIKELLSFKPDCVFIALHGGKGESGIVQGLLETLGFPYTGSGVLSSAICMNKIITKKILLSYNIPTPGFVEISSHNAGSNIKIPFGYPAVVKPANLGSTIGISIVESEKELKKAIKLAFSLDREAFIEKFVPGREITISIIGNEKPQVLPPIEIRTKRKFYDYTAKYKKGGSIHIIPPEIPKNILKKAGQARLTTISGGKIKC